MQIRCNEKCFLYRKSILNMGKKGYFASEVCPDACPYCNALDTVETLTKEEISFYGYFKGMPYYAKWHCKKCKQPVLKSYSGGIFMGKKLDPNDNRVKYRFLLTLKDRKVTFLDNFSVLHSVISEVKKARFYDHMDIFYLSTKISVYQGQWYFYLSYPSSGVLVHFTGKLLSGEMIMKKALELLDFNLSVW